MKVPGLLIRVDDLGRIAIPVELHRKIGICDRDEVEVMLEKDTITLRKPRPSCVFCGTEEGLLAYSKRSYCVYCIGELIE
ncbi:AbrB/MazE/SpoVT family DNA-binding domain-containing protein [Aneurinibacillus terranovensis]|uniref:AbrB/MazE/SpoVT family DNA-binding domain-containing protein n=1 Tax=Aneurinibacillus terranovensis TaxID=278991 RepID=UPI000425083B|nr:AbrB/MazE/SpoVT family DNA-binding domain-containing protein [Aneurinibacillus terranovensis]